MVFLLLLLLGNWVSRWDADAAAASTHESCRQAQQQQLHQNNSIINSLRSGTKNTEEKAMLNSMLFAKDFIFVIYGFRLAGRFENSC